MRSSRAPATRFMPRLFGRLIVPLVLAALLCFPAACGSGGLAPPTAADSAAAGAGREAPAFSYEVRVRGLLADTLRGQAEFGVVFDPVTRREQWVLSMRSGGDVTSGIYLARPDTARPQAGDYPVVKRRPLGRADSVRDDSTSAFSMIYRAGMRRSFHSQSGTVEITTATDTLLEGTFRVTLRGSASLPGQPPREGAVSARGSFRAEKATVGFMFGI